MYGSFVELLDLIARAIEIGGIGVIVVGLIWASAGYIQTLRSPERKEAFRRYRANVGRAILLGLEFLVAADIIKTVAIEPTVESVVVLAGIVLVRTFLSFSLEVEIEGRWPWRRGDRVEVDR